MYICIQYDIVPFFIVVAVNSEINLSTQNFLFCAKVQYNIILHNAEW